MIDVNDINETFLGVIVCAGMKDRFAAMRIREEKGVEAALEFLRDCDLSSEAVASSNTD